MTDVLTSVVRAGGTLLLMCLCRLLAQPLTEAAHAGDLDAPGWGILVALALMSSICTLALIKAVVDFVINLIGS
ncbi:hypothetical protein V8O11_23990 [Erwinia aphidicola]|uniref:Type III secretion protein S n=1 Tax=Erwinia aphidicola TaxID=68334 RepID=A0ABU8DM09_ERWAP